MARPPSTICAFQIHRKTMSLAVNKADVGIKILLSCQNHLEVVRIRETDSSGNSNNSMILDITLVSTEIV